MPQRPRAARIVYTTAQGRLCPECGSPVQACRCRQKGERAEESPGPACIVAKLRIETKGRGGKMVTVIDGLPREDGFLARLAQDLKRACGTGGSAGDGVVELQGDRRDRVRELLAKKGFRVKG